MSSILLNVALNTMFRKHAAARCSVIRFRAGRRR